MSFLLDEKVTRKTREELLAEMPEDLRAKMELTLSSPNFLRWVVDGIEEAGVAGERFLALTIFLTGTSRHLGRPLAVIVQGPSASGKSYSIEQVAKLFPPEAILAATDMTRNALYYLEPGELEHRFVVAGERPRRQNDETAQTTKALRELISAGHLEKVVTVSDGEGPKTVKYRQEGPIAYVESTTAPELFEEDANRCLVLHSDERAEQTGKILLAEAKQLTGETAGERRDQVREEFQCLHRLLVPLQVVIPFAERLAELFPKEPLEVRRSFSQLTSMVQTIALLHQYQRERDEAGRIVAQAEDYFLARLLLDEVFGQSLGRKASEALKRFVARLRKLTGEHTAKELAQAMNMSERTVREHLAELLERGLVTQSTPARGPIPAGWMIPTNLEIHDVQDSPLPRLFDVCGVSEDELQLPEMPADWASADLSEVPF